MGYRLPLLYSIQCITFDSDSSWANPSRIYQIFWYSLTRTFLIGSLRGKWPKHNTHRICFMLFVSLKLSTQVCPSFSATSSTACVNAVFLIKAVLSFQTSPGFFWVNNWLLFSALWSDWDIRSVFRSSAGKVLYWRGVCILLCKGICKNSPTLSLQWLDAWQWERNVS